MKKLIKFTIFGSIFAITFFLMSSLFMSKVSGQALATYCAYTKIENNLWKGNWKNNREEVRILQNFLFNYYGVNNEINTTGYFGRLTKNYVLQFQREHSLYPVTGGVGPITRNKMKKLCEGEDLSGGGANCKIWYDGCNTCSRQYVGGPQICTLMACIQGGDAAWFAAHKPVCREYFSNNTDISPVIKSFTGPVKLNLGEKGVWKIEASIFNNQPLTYNITWGDEVYDQAMSSASIFMNSVINQVTTFEHTYNRVGTFTVSIEVKAQNGRTAKTTQTVTVINPSYVGTGTLYGKLSIGPICPVETYPPQANCLPNYANDPIVIYQANKTTFVQNVVADNNGNFSVVLPTGTYWVRVPSRESNFGSQRGVPTYIEITRGNSVNLNINIDTGIR